MLLVLLLLSYSSAYYHKNGQVFRLGGLFEATEIEKERAFSYAVDRLNNNHRQKSTSGSFVSSVRRVTQYDSFKVSEAVCELLGEGVVGVFGPQSDHTTDHVQSICDTMEVPHVEQRWDVRQRRGSCLVNLYPHPTSIAKVLADLVKSFKWGSFTIIFDQSEDLIKLKDLLSFYDHRGFPVTVRQLEGDNYRDTLRGIKYAGERNIVLDCATDKLYDVLLQAMQVGLLGSEHNYILTNLDMHTVNLEAFVYGGTNITGIRLIDPDDPVVKETVKYFRTKETMRRTSDNMIDFNETKIKLETGLVIDAVSLFAQGLDHLRLSRDVDSQFLNCSEKVNWRHGFSLINYMKMFPE